MLPPVTTNALPELAPLTVQAPVKVPAVVFAPVVTVVVFNVPILPVVITALAIVAFAVTVAKRTVIVSPTIALFAVILLACRLPVTVTEPNVVVPEPPDCANVNHAFALLVPSAGQTHNVLALVLYHN